MRCLRAISSVTRADRLQHIKITEDNFTPESSQMSSETEDSSGLDMFAICQDIIRQAYKQDFKGQTADERKDIEEME